MTQIKVKTGKSVGLAVLALWIGLITAAPFLDGPLHVRPVSPQESARIWGADPVPPFCASHKPFQKVCSLDTCGEDYDDKAVPPDDPEDTLYSWIASVCDIEHPNASRCTFQLSIGEFCE